MRNYSVQLFNKVFRHYYSARCSTQLFIAVNGLFLLDRLGQKADKTYRRSDTVKCMQQKEQNRKCEIKRMEIAFLFNGADGHIYRCRKIASEKQNRKYPAYNPRSIAAKMPSTNTKGTR